MGEKLTKKQKKATEFRKKRKLDDSIADVPEEDTVDNNNNNESEVKVTKDKDDSKKKSKDASKDKSKDSSKDNKEDAGESEPKKKKRRRGKGASKDETKEGAETKEGEGDNATGEGAKPEKPKNIKFIVFVGNLPYNITKEQLEKHFENCGKISSVRVQTDKVTGKGKGFAFMEFPEVEAMQKALYFNKTLIKDRPINVELTAGGGGSKSVNRKQKITQKNDALNEERRKVHERHIAPAKEAKSSYAAANPPEVQKAPPIKNIKKPYEISGANSITVDRLAVRLGKST
ncbi:hypothetical protein BG011_003566 [Mortierella polycephala]|uniref:RRM domain-containing protein n=1 Tax=Mortierella polycephala TaxID=41804 RepID=A0A9P6U2T1_9FUNG|nr:hypothetical protein BG011_003566 [Mortierella polycephala]